MTEANVAAVSSAIGDVAASIPVPQSAAVATQQVLLNKSTQQSSFFSTRNLVIIGVVAALAVAAVGFFVNKRIRASIEKETRVIDDGWALNYGGKSEAYKKALEASREKTVDDHKEVAEEPEHTGESSDPNFSTLAEISGEDSA